MPLVAALALAVAATLAPGCGGGGCEAARTRRAEVAAAGCASFRRTPGPVCLVSDSTTLTLAVRAGVGARVVTDPRSTELAAADDGWRRFQLTPGPDADRVSVEVGEGGARAGWSITLGRFSELPSVAAAQRARAERDLDGALRVVEDALHAEPGPEDRARLLGMRARVYISRGAMTPAEADLWAALALDREAGLVSDAMRDSMALVWILVDGLRLADASAVLDTLLPAVEGFDEARPHIAFNRASIAQKAGHHREALRALDEANIWATRLALDALGAQVRQVTANVLLELGRFAEAGGMLTDLLAGGAGQQDGCAKATLLTNLGWARLAIVEAGGAAETLPVLTEALQTWRSDCASPPEISNALVNLALAQFQLGHIPEARERLEAAASEGAGGSPFIEAWRLDLEGRLALAEGRPERAIEAFDDLAEVAREAGVADAALRAALGRAEALAALGHNDQALAGWVDAEAKLDDALRTVPLGEGLGSFLASATRGPRDHVDLLLRLERPEEALAVARRSRAREVVVLRRLRALSALGPEARARWEAAVAAWRAERQALDAAAQEDWKLAADRRAAAADARAERERKLRRVLDDALAIVGPSAPTAVGPVAKPGELALLAHPGRRGWWMFAATAGAVRATHIDALPERADAITEALLEPFRAEIGAATRLRVLAYGPLREVDFHALPWDGAPLGARMSVEYAVDLPHLPGAPANAGPAALVVADPARNLAGARAEVDAVRELLTRDGEPPAVMDAASATLAAVQDRLPGVGLFHFAGHGWFGGLGGWESALGLASGQRLTVGDILALARVPATVVLSGCETGRSDRGGPGATLGLAEAFAIAGAQAIIAASRPVDDGLAAALSVALYANGRDALRDDPAAALRRAQASVRQSHPTDDWASFRLIVP